MLRSSRRAIAVAALLVSVGGCGGAALADGIDVIEPAPVFIAPPTLWNSIYVGVHGGWADADIDWTYRNISPYSAPGPAGPIRLPGDEFSPDGFIGGGQIGFNHQFGQWVLGAEVSYSGLDLSESHDSPRRFVGTRQVVSTDVDELVTVTARLGVLLNPRWLAYVKGGYANAEVKTGGFVTGAPGLDFSDSNREDGWTLGLGTEYRVTDEVGLALEYDHVDLGSDSRIGDLASRPTATDVHYEADTEIDAVTARLNWHWNRSRPVVEPLK